tara:strand:+ start:192 stop:419 length:228 start_codon:yes stop_codon:yes gene_type:complete
MWDSEREDYYAKDICVDSYTDMINYLVHTLEGNNSTVRLSWNPFIKAASDNGTDILDRTKKDVKRIIKRHKEQAS